MTGIVERIGAICKEKGTTLIGLERELGFGRGTIRNWDKNRPSFDKIIKVANKLNVIIDQIIPDTLNRFNSGALTAALQSAVKGGKANVGN